MGESKLHTILLTKLAEHVAGAYAQNSKGLILLDSPSSISKPPLITEYRPDLYFLNPHDGMTIIGEAKTEQDLETPHSTDQITCFLRECAKPLHIFILAVPWHTAIYAKSTLSYLCKKNNLGAVSFIVPDTFPG